VVDDELARLGLEFQARSRRAKRSVITDAYEAGQEAGQRLACRRGLNAAYRTREV
jgi:hypothetical protein